MGHCGSVLESNELHVTEVHNFITNKCKCDQLQLQRKEITGAYEMLMITKGIASEYFL